MTATEIAAAIRAAIDKPGMAGAMDLIFATMPNDLRLLLDELDRLQRDHHRVSADAQARVDAAVVRALAAERERDTLRARLAEMERQEPLFHYRPIMDGGMYEGPHWSKSIGGQMMREEMPGEWKPLYARPVPAIPAAPETRSLTCDVCGAECSNPWHYSAGDRRHLHACDACWPGINPAPGAAR